MTNDHLNLLAIFDAFDEIMLDLIEATSAAVESSEREASSATETSKVADRDAQSAVASHKVAPTT